MSADRLEIAPGVSLRDEDLKVEYSRSSGPGGQHVNRTESRVTLRFPLLDCASIGPRLRERLRSRLSHRLTKEGEILISVERHRQRLQNLREARSRLVDLLSKAAKEPKKRRKTQPTAASRKRRQRMKQALSGKKKERRFKGDEDA